MCCFTFGHIVLKNYLPTFTLHAHLYNHLAYLKCIFHLCRAQYSTYFAHLVSCPECFLLLTVKDVPTFCCSAITSEFIIFSIARELVKEIYELCTPSFKCENTKENSKLPRVEVAQHIQFLSQ